MLKLEKIWIFTAFPEHMIGLDSNPAKRLLTQINQGW